MTSSHSICKIVRHRAIKPNLLLRGKWDDFSFKISTSSQKERVLRGVSQLCLSFILHFVAHHVSVFIPIEIYLSIQYSSETVTHLLPMMIAECSSVSLLLFLLHSYAFCYCNLQLSQVSAIKHTSNGMQNRKCRIFLTLHKTPHTNFPLAHTPTSQFVAQKFPQG